MKSVNSFDIAIVIVYFLIIMGIGLYFMRVNKGGKEYFTGGSMIPWWMSGMSLYMGNFSAWIFTGAAGFAYSTGLFTILYFCISPVAYLIGSSMTATKWRRTRSISPVEYTLTRYTMSTQQLMGWVLGMNFILSGGVQLASTCKLFAPLLGFDLRIIVLLIGAIILLHNLLGGLWGDMAMDVVQGVVLLGITFIVMPLSLRLVGGPMALWDALPPLSFDHTYNGVHYTGHWLAAILMITTIGIASGAAPKFYSVKNERDARRVGKTAALFALSIPFVFGIPPLVAKVYWPDLSAVPFFAPFTGINPQDLVFVGLVMKLLPHGLIGVFIAAMLAATMTTLSTVYNMVSSIFSRDIYQGMSRRTLTDRQLLTAGRIAAVCIGITVMGLATWFVTSKTGIFNLMQTFFTLFNIPLTVPIAFGLIFRRVPKWSAFGAVVWGLITGATVRLLLNWDIGPQVYLAFAMTFAIFSTSRWTGTLYTKNKLLLAAISVAIAAGMAALFLATPVGDVAEWKRLLAIASGLALGGSLYFFARVFALETEEERAQVAAFFKKVDTPVDVEREVYAAGRRQVSTLPIVGRTMMLLGGMICLAFLQHMSLTERVAVAAMSCILLGFGGFMWYYGRNMERRGETMRH
ncbi:MAG: hypothetical protein IPP94_04225 [Ignavibacteria bacterium]|nr:hypothetical protein [Ignavibacteria bacterium]